MTVSRESNDGAFLSLSYGRHLRCAALDAIHNDWLATMIGLPDPQRHGSVT
jgi:hypothetical protein